jgi:tRNA pseudouridine32 synthase/23S rRNA pseudouridine746 synthase
MSTAVFNAADHQASTLYLPPGPWATVLDCLCERFAAISREQWLDRIARGRVLDADGAPITVQLAYREGLRIHADPGRGNDHLCR